MKYILQIIHWALHVLCDAGFGAVALIARRNDEAIQVQARSQDCSNKNLLKASNIVENAIQNEMELFQLRIKN
jgi:hypothetical protein